MLKLHFIGYIRILLYIISNSDECPLNLGKAVLFSIWHLQKVQTSLVLMAQCFIIVSSLNQNPAPSGLAHFLPFFTPQLIFFYRELPYTTCATAFL